MLGEACALLAALTWSVSVILFKRSEAVTPLAMNLFKNTVAAALLGLTLAALLLSGWTELPLQRSRTDWARLLLSGVLGIAASDTLIFMALRRLGASLLAVVDCIYAPTIVALSVLVLHEPVPASFLAGGALVVGGVLLTVTERAPAQEQVTPLELGGAAELEGGHLFLCGGALGDGQQDAADHEGSAGEEARGDRFVEHQHGEGDDGGRVDAVHHGQQARAEASQGHEDQGVGGGDAQDSAEEESGPVRSAALQGELGPAAEEEGCEGQAEERRRDRVLEQIHGQGRDRL